VKAANGGGNHKRGAQSKVQQFLEDILADGEPVPVKRIIAEGAKQGFSYKQLNTAKQHLPGVISEQKPGGWTWQMIPF
jgi:hypothetical protein